MKVPRRSWWLALFLIPLGLGLARLEFNVEVLDLLPADLPVVQGLRLYQQHFANTRELVITLDSPDPDHTEHAAAALAELLVNQTELQASVVWQPPWQDQPGQTAELIAYAWLNQAPNAWSDLQHRLQPDHIHPWLELVRERLATSFSPAELARAAYDPFDLTRLPAANPASRLQSNGGEELFSSSDGTFRVLFVQAPATLDNYRACVQWFQLLRDTVDAWHLSLPSQPTLTIGYTGQPAFMAEIGGGMERDMVRSVAGTTLVIGILFGLVHRRLFPLLWLLLLLSLILACTLALGGLLLGTLNVLSIGFAAILLGLSADYGLVLYQESRIQPHTPARTLQRELTPAILWAALTTSAAFFALTLSRLPGLAQLGTLVTLGILLAAIIMLRLFLPPLLARQRPPDNTDSRDSDIATRPASPAMLSRTASNRPLLLAWLVTGVLPIIAVLLLTRGAPILDHGSGALRPRDSAAYAALEQIKERMERPGEPLWLLMRGTNDAAVAARLDEVGLALDAATRSGWIDGYRLPAALWPNPDQQIANRPVIRTILDRQPLILNALEIQGFTDQAAAFTRQVFLTWEQATEQPAPFLPANPSARWLLDQFVTRGTSGHFALGLIHPAVDPVQLHAHLAPQLDDDDTWLTGWAVLGEQVLLRVRDELRWLSALMLFLLIGALALAFRRPAEVILSLLAVGFSLLCLLTIMAVAGWSWNLMNLMALPLLLGTTVDYSIHMQLALRRHAGNLAAIRRGTGRALLLCGATTFTGFGSLAWSANAGLASLGQICAAGLACATFTAVFLLPAWWRFATRNRPDPGSASHPSNSPTSPQPDKPSRLYRAGCWRLGLAVVRYLPGPLCVLAGRCAATLFRWLRPARFQVVHDNLLPLVNDQPPAAHAAARSLFRQFGTKLADLLRFESGQPVEDLFGELQGADVFFAALESRRGVLLVTPHLGNWEFGAPLLTRRGVKLLALTLEEPHAPLTELRRAARARWGIETLVIQQNPFAFLEVIRQLEQGAAVALLIDRPPPPTAVQVELFGRPFAASIAPAELARASGCIILPVTVLRHQHRYSAQVLPEIHYDRAALRDLNARRQLTQQILRAFEPALRQHPDQWFHFVPIWPPPGAR
jgi:uncharacterized protein